MGATVCLSLVFIAKRRDIAVNTANEIIMQSMKKYLDINIICKYKLWCLVKKKLCDI